MNEKSMSSSIRNSELKTQNLPLVALLKEMGADVFGIADMARYDREILGLGDDISAKYPFAISFGLLVSRGVLKTLTDGPTLFYLHHYRQVNYRLDMIAYLLAKKLEGMGYDALPLAASQMVDWQNQKGHISHKHIGQAAGIGWIGRNNLLVHPRYGSRVRYNTILTNMPLAPDEPAEFGCGWCTACMSSCPASAIREEPADFDHRGCFAMLQVFKNKRNLGHHICGLCVRACGGKE
ncbi:MAG: Epoxyqueuosine reductase [Syntrophorhabdaceae bacterium PtaU1.Bin034]|jgi:epoxyqueuosine reductase QueG|nr:MAG: Epoxyqueuosine reductase [Syntrophorhabdaceae bacterium PtaU1.Bin034]